MQRSRFLSILAGAFVGLVPVDRTAHALTVTVDKCLAGQIKIVGRGTAAYVNCYAKGAAKGMPTDAACLAKAAAKVAPAFDELESGKICPTERTGDMRGSAVASFAADIDATVGHAAGKCDTAKTKSVGKYVAAVAGCYAKAAGKTGTVDAACVAKAMSKLGAAIAKAESKDDCSHLGQTTVLTDDGSALVETETCALDPGCGEPCGNGLSDPDEACDESAPAALWNRCGPEFICTNCTCACPTTLAFVADAAAPQTTLDLGSTGIAHRQPILGNADLTLALSNCTGANRPCGLCELSGPIANADAGAGQLDSQRCSTDSSKKCTSDAVCLARTCLGGTNDGASCSADGQCPNGGSCPPAGRCGFYAGSYFPMAVGGTATCIVNQFDGAVSGTVDVESGAMATSAALTMRLYASSAVDQPCHRCSDSGGINDGIAGGSCDGGPRIGRACDANGAVPGRPDYGRTSLDCPPSPASLIGTLAIDASNATDAVIKTLTPASPNCTGSAGNKCLCDTCNDADADPCSENADCPDPAGPIGPICGGRRCLGGANAGAACAVNSECPTSSCGRPGETTQPEGCIESDEGPAIQCPDADGDGEGECTFGPIDQLCTRASGHGQRGCLTDADCGGTPGSCASNPRKCFPTGGGTFQPGGDTGTDTLVAFGMADSPMADVSTPTLGAVFCVGPTRSSSLNAIVGLPGPARVTVQGQMVGHP